MSVKMSVIIFKILFFFFVIALDLVPHLVGPAFLWCRCRYRDR